MRTLIKLWKDESGATAIEYGLIAALIAVGVIAGANALSGSITTAFTDLGTTLENATPE